MCHTLQVRWVQRSLASLQRTKWKGGTACAAPLRMRPAAAATGAAAGSGVRDVQASTTAGPAAPEAAAGVLQQAQILEGRRQASREQQRLQERDGVLQQMAHLADALGQYAGERLLAAWHWLLEVRVTAPGELLCCWET